jgi:hypothetical protein
LVPVVGWVREAPAEEWAREALATAPATEVRAMEVPAIEATVRVSAQEPEQDQQGSTD